MNLRKTISQNDRKGFLESSLSIVVDYNPDTDTVDGILHVYVFNIKERVQTEITAIMWDMFNAALDLMIESINWKEVYVDTFLDKLIHSNE